MLEHLTDQQLEEYKGLLQSLNHREQAIRSNKFDTKFAYHTVRLLGECEQILEEGNLDLQRNNEQLKAIRRGELTLKDIEDLFARKEVHLQTLYEKSTLPHSPDWKFGQEVLMTMIEQHYGKISDAVKTDSGALLLAELEQLVEKYR